MSSHHIPVAPKEGTLQWINGHWHVDILTGIVSSISRSGGENLGSINVHGYVTLRAQGHIEIRRSHLVWYKHHGVWPSFLLDHDDQDKTNDRIGNLKASDTLLNAANRPKIGDLPKGVTRTRSKVKPYKAQISRNNITKSLGYFVTPDEAHQRYLQEVNRDSD